MKLKRIKLNLYLFYYNVKYTIIRRTSKNLKTQIKENKKLCELFNKTLK